LDIVRSRVWRGARPLATAWSRTEHATAVLNNFTRYSLYRRRSAPATITNTATGAVVTDARGWQHGLVVAALVLWRNVRLNLLLLLADSFGLCLLSEAKPILSHF